MNERRRFVAGMVKVFPTQRKRERTGTKLRTKTYQYYFTVDGKDIFVCQKFFLGTLCISDKFISTVMRNKVVGGTVTEDNRGKKESSNKIPEEIRENVKSHIRKFPAYESHYSRERTKRKYLVPGLNITRMYKLYLEDCKQQNLPTSMVAKKWFYYSCLNNEFNLSFKSPANYTCDFYNDFAMKLKETGHDKEILEENERHIPEDSYSNQLKNQDKEDAKGSPKNKIIIVDLQKCLPTPFITNDQSFNLRKLWTLNYTIHETGSDTSFCMLWDETKAGRGGNEMASCLMKWAEMRITNELEELTILSNNCPGQNRNKFMLLCYIWLVRKYPNLKIINHNFLLPRHTCIDVDGDLSIIERVKKMQPAMSIMSPWDWAQMLRASSGPRRKFYVTEMGLKDFKNFGALITNSDSPLVLRKKNDGGPLNISEMVQFQVRSETPNLFYFKHSFEGPFYSVDLTRNTRRAKWPIYLPTLRDRLIPLSASKYQDLQKILQWVPEMFHNFYKNLPQGTATAEAESNSDGELW